jgi:hypothetical protein
MRQPSSHRSRHAVAALTVSGVLLLLTLVSCHSIFGYDEDYVDVGSLGGGGATTSGSGGAAPECSNADQCTGVDTTCSFRACASGSCNMELAAAGTACTESGGAVCDGLGDCVECLAGSDCATSVCQSNQCVAATCTDGAQNGTETDIDCGGGCAPCINGQGCGGATDCESLFCGASNTCSACAADGDCSGAADTYCDGANCVALKQNGDSCTDDGQCLSDNCPADDSVCCDAACGATCVACLMTKTGSPNGQCANVTGGDDPEAECGDGGAASCGPSGTGCSGTGPSCALYDNATECIAGTCNAGQQISPGLCDGSGSCVAGSMSACDPYTCNSGATACLTSCSADGDCISGNYCTGGSACAAKKANGNVCVGSNECSSGFCIDGVCCDVLCSGLCMACDVGGSVGSCSFIPASTDPDDDCGGSDACNGAGACGKGVGAGCAVANECASGFCVDTKCCDSACSGLCEACNKGRTDGTEGICSPVKPETDPDDECAGTLECDGNRACKSARGESCSVDGDCAGGFCVDGVCCQSACNLLCQSCLGADTGSPDGDCKNVTTGTDPANECAGADVCKSAACVAVDGDPCTVNNDCLNGKCSADDLVCCNNDCKNECDACVASKTGGTDGVCAPIIAYTDPDSECLAGELCNGVDKCELDEGESCGADGDCISNSCSDGVCCDSACSGACQACSMALTGSADGTCSDVTDGTDPDDDCLGAPICLSGGCFTCDQRPVGIGPDAPCPPQCDGGCLNGVCTINCSGDNECDGNTIDCPADYACVVNCTGKQACKTARINCPDTHECTINCNAEQACEDGRADCSADGSCELVCGNNVGSQDCKNMALNCGNNTCQATCSGGETPSVNGCGSSPCPANCGGC